MIEIYQYYCILALRKDVEAIKQVYKTYNKNVQKLLPIATIRMCMVTSLKGDLIYVLLCRS